MSFQVIIIVLTTSAAVFGAKELFKKFAIYQRFKELSPTKNYVQWSYDTTQHPQGMHNIVLKADKPFVALIGFHLDVPALKYFGFTHTNGFDYYGCVESNENGLAVFSTYLGKNPADFFFEVAGVDKEEVTVSLDEAKNFHATETFPPHWWQRLGIF